jgi:hypothetical protein
MKDARAADYVNPSLSERRLERQWQRVASRVERGPRAAWPRAAMGASVLVMAMVAVFFGLRRGPLVAGDAFTVASLPNGQQELAFSDGSRVTVAPGGRLRVDHATASDVTMHLEAGRARFEVKHDAARRFSVMVAHLEVVDRGTRFEIALFADARPGVDVRVDEGEVELRDSSNREPRRIRAGESWSDRPPEAVEAAMSSDDVGPARKAPPPPGVAPRLAETRAKASAETRSAVESRAARELFELGTTAKLEGRLREAADAFDALRLRHRADGHAALAALELGRLRLNHLGDPAGALAALEDAVKLGPRAPFREEAESRIIDALAALGRNSDCVRARQQFLALRPDSVHAGAVAGKCGAR